MVSVKQNHGLHLTSKRLFIDTSNGRSLCGPNRLRTTVSTGQRVPSGRNDPVPVAISGAVQSRCGRGHSPSTLPDDRLELLRVPATRTTPPRVPGGSNHQSASVDMDNWRGERRAMMALSSSGGSPGHRTTGKTCWRVERRTDELLP